MVADCHVEIYEAAALYDLAFSYRDYDREVGFLRRVFEDRRGRPPARFLELAAGPARHALGMAAAGVASTGLDLSPAMAGYARELARSQNTALSYVTADMRSFELGDRFDLAACMLCSATYLLTDQDIVAHLRAVAACLSADGLYVLELPHPDDLDGPGTTKDAWTVQTETGTLDVTWRELDDQAAAPDPAIRTCLARLAFTPKAGSAVVVEQRAPQRLLRRGELERLVAASGVFAVEAVWGALDPEVPLEDAGAWRMVAVLRQASRASLTVPGGPASPG